MITHLEVDNLRAFRRISLDLREGVNFIVGPNGIGKTSLLEAISLALVGEALTVDELVALMRDLDKPARVALTIIQDGIKYEIERNLSENGRKGRCYLREGDQEQVAQRWDELTERIEDVFETTTAFFRRITYMSEGDVFRFVNEPPGRAVMSQIDRLLGIDQLETFQTALRNTLRYVREKIDDCQELLAAYDRQAEAFAKQVDDFHREEPFVTLSHLEAKISDLESVLETVGVRKAEITRALDELKEVEADLAAVQDILGEGEPEDKARLPVIQWLSQHVDSRARAIQLLEERARDTRESVGRFKGQNEAHEDALRLLQPPDLVPGDRRTIPCPVCRKDLTYEERIEIIDEIQKKMDDLVRSQRDAERLLKRQDTALRKAQAELDSLVECASRMKRWMERYPDVKTLNVARSRMRTLQEELRQVEFTGEKCRDELRNLRDIASSLSVLKERLETLGFHDLASLRRGLVTLTKAELVFDACRGAITATIGEQRDQNLQEVYQEIAETWQKFVERSEWTVQFAQDGKPSLRDMVESRTFDLTQLSGGEKTAFLTIIHSVLARHFSNARFMMVDEPLEHLDSVNRRSLVRFFMEAAQNGFFEQMIVTTFEESLVRKYLSDPDANVIYLDAYRPEFRLLIEESA